MSSDSWLSDYNYCLRNGQDIMEKISERNKQSKNSSTFARLQAQTRASMKQFSGEIIRLKNSLIRASSSYHITQRELERRQVMIDELITKEKQIEQAHRNEGPEGGRSALFGAGAGLGHDPWGVKEEDETTRNLSIGDIRQQQSHAIKEQDQGLEVLSSVISRQKQMAHDIGDEVDYQNELLDDIHDHVDRTDQRLIKETRHVQHIDRKSGACGYWVVIVLLLITIVVVVAVPYNGKP
ncbi:unnamed protein product [Owenia fusiformis]|uniref:Syntaxin-8 n=1 Tax=Owenia fusiformis TaxID=6347 RepID=A0A8J1UMD5_OWEFU|nr:unnamed protein product [Owenia fusiformis]